MQLRAVGRSAIGVSVVSFGCGPVSGLMTGTDEAAQHAAVAAALAVGVNWFDTAPGYGQGRSEANLGRTLTALEATGRAHVATKVRVPLDCADVDTYIRRTAEESRRRLGPITLLQLHNGVTARRGDQPDTLAAEAVLTSVVPAFRRLQEEGLVGHVGLTGTGDAAALRAVVRSGAFDTLQVPYNLLNPSAGQAGTAAEGDAEYGGIMADCTDLRMGVFAIRVFAGGALLGLPPSAHTLKTAYFPLALYRRDADRARAVAEAAGGPDELRRRAVAFALEHPAVCSAIIGFGSADHVAEVVAALNDT